MIDWLVPGASALGVLTTVPIAVHLLSQRYRRQRPFPTARFLAEHRSGSSRLARLRQLLVLALRTLALAALALAVCGPVLRGRSGEAGAPVVIVLDASGSMRQHDGGSTCWEAARGAVERLSRELAARPLLLILAGDQTRASGNQPELDRGGMRTLLASAHAGYGTGSVPQSVAMGLSALSAAGLGGDLYLVTDGAATCLAGVDPQGVPDQVLWHTVVVGGGGDNVGIVALGVEPGVALAGRPCTLTARIANHSATARQLSVALAIGEQHRVLPLSLIAEGTASATFTITPSAAGVLSVHAQILSTGGTNDLSEDDERWGVLAVDAALPVTVFSDAAPTDPAAALKPVLAALQSAGLSPTVVSSASLAHLSEDDRGIVVTVSVATAPDTAALQRHLLAGGCWLQVISSDGDAALCHGLGELPAPAQPAEAVDLAARAHGMSLAARALDHPLVVALRGREPLLSQIESYRHRAAAPADGSTVALAWEDGSVALAERPVGRGRWVLLNIDPTAAASNLATLEVLPLMLGRLPLIGMPPALADCASACGTTRPTGTALLDPAGARVALLDGGCALTMPGLYHALDGVTAVVGTGVPPSEGDLRHAPLPVSAMGVTAAQAWSGAQDTPLWPYLLVIGLLALVAELLCLSRGERR